ncbi:hypothetical protein [Pseudoduganella sp. R-34]|uniref:hypothetical protein n=1 Tax=Pseudoduganella sp. R-34 TaxID=3404062 RepID=UPI003CEDD549
MLIEYCCLVEGSEALHVLRPREPGANDNQHVLVFQGARDWALLCLNGDWEYEAAMHCLCLAAGYLAEGDGTRRKSFSVGSYSKAGVPQARFAVGAKVEVARGEENYGSLGRLSIRLADDAQQPFQRTGTRSGISDLNFSVNRTNEELSQIGKLISRLAQASFEPVFESARNDWFVPHFLDEVLERFPISLDALAHGGRVLNATAHIAEVCPAGFSSLWLDALSEIPTFEVATCLDCEGYFPRRLGQKWMKQCIGCHGGNPATAFNKEALDGANRVEPWLVACTSGENDELIGV